MFSTIEPRYIITFIKIILSNKKFSRLAMADSDDVDSDDGQSVETKPFKPGRGRKKTEKKLNSGE